MLASSISKSPIEIVYEFEEAPIKIWVDALSPLTSTCIIEGKQLFTELNIPKILGIAGDLDNRTIFLSAILPHQDFDNRSGFLSFFIQEGYKPPIRISAEIGDSTIVGGQIHYTEQIVLKN